MFHSISLRQISSLRGKQVNGADVSYFERLKKSYSSLANGTLNKDLVVPWPPPYPSHYRSFWSLSFLGSASPLDTIVVKLDPFSHNPIGIFLTLEWEKDNSCHANYFSNHWDPAYLRRFYITLAPDFLPSLIQILKNIYAMILQWWISVQNTVLEISRESNIYSALSKHLLGAH